VLWRTQRTCLIALFSRILQQARRSYPEKTARRLPLVPIGGARRSRFSSFAANPVTYQTGSKYYLFSPNCLEEVFVLGVLTAVFVKVEPLNQR
jgi:hypothetical protein